MSEHTPTPWKWDSVYKDGSGPDALRGPNNEDVAVPFLDWSPEPGEGLDDWGLEISDADKEFIVRAVNSHDALAAALEKSQEAVNAQIHCEQNPGNERLERKAGDLITESRKLARAALAAAQAKE